MPSVEKKQTKSFFFMMPVKLSFMHALLYH